MIRVAPQVSVIICAYTEDRWDDVVEAVKSVQQQTVPPHEIIVVIDHNPRLLERVRTSIPGIIAIENSRPRGLSGARNSGIAVARGNLIAYLDDDAVAEPDWLAHLIGCCTDTQILGAGGTVTPHWLTRKPRWFPEEFYWVVGCSYRGMPAQRSVVRNPFGGCTCFRREIFESIGGFTDGIGRVGKRPLGGEETELCIRAKQYWPAKSFLYEPRARIRHRVPPERTRLRYFFSRCYAEGVSKATVACYVGARDSLAPERSYMLRTLPTGVIRDIKDGFVHLDLAGFLRAGAIIAGLMVTIEGYLAGSLSQRLTSLKGKYHDRSQSFAYLFYQRVRIGLFRR